MGYDLVKDIFTAWDDDEAGWDGYNFRIRIQAADLDRNVSEFYIKFGYNAVTWKFATCYVGHKAASGDDWDFDGTQVQVLFSAAAGGTVGATGLISDKVTYSLDATKDLIIALYFNDGAFDDIPYAAKSGAYTYYKAGADESSTSNVSGYDTYTDFLHVLEWIGEQASTIEISMTEGMTSDDSPLGNAPIEVLTEGMTFSDAFLGIAPLETLSESMTFSDSISRTFETTKILYETNNFSDSWEAINWSEFLRNYDKTAIRRYYCTLTGSADGTTDITLPISSFQSRMRSGDPSYLSVIIPTTAYESQINARSNGDIYIEMAYFVGGVEQYREEIARATVEDIYYYQGGRSKSMRIDGHKTITFPSQTVELRNVTYKQTKDSGEYIFKCAIPDLYLRPGQTAVYGSDSFTVGLVTYVISPTLQYMQVSEASN